MLAKVHTCAVIGLEGTLVGVEVDIANGLPAFAVVGLGDASVQESRERVRAAIRNSGLSFPMKRITVNLAPADIRKAGPAYDLSIALGILLASEQLAADLANAALIGELGLDGSVRHADGVLPMVAIARRHGMQTIFVPYEDAPEAAIIEGVRVLPVRTLMDVVGHLTGEHPIPVYLSEQASFADDQAFPVDFADVQGQEHVKRAMEIAAAGAHNMLLSGTPGSGKTMMARALLSILPPLTLNEALEVTNIYSVAGQLTKQTPLIRQRPWCSPHHTISLAGLVGGGGTRVRPGIISLAHRGVLFLDEVPEFGSKLEVLRQPLEDRVVTISRANGTYTYPAALMLIAAQNPCPCGWFGDAERPCTCSSAMVTRYQRRLSGPFLDRIDMHVDVPRVNYEKLTSERRGERSIQIRERVIGARQRQSERFRGTRLLSNADMGAADIRNYCALDGAGQSLMKAATRQLHFSARSYHRVLKLARTIADLAGSPGILPAHLAEALQYRQRMAI